MKGTFVGYANLSGELGQAYILLLSLNPGALELHDIRVIQFIVSGLRCLQ